MSYVMDPHAADKQAYRDNHRSIRDQMVAAIKENNGPLPMWRLAEITGAQVNMIGKMVNFFPSYLRNVKMVKRANSRPFSQLIGLHPHLEPTEWR